MLNVIVRFSLPMGYHNPFVSFHSQGHLISFALNEGTHVARSNFIDLGIFHGFEGKRLLGQFEFKYDYNCEKGVITLCDANFDSIDTLSLITMPEATNEYCRQSAGGGGYAGDDRLANPHWNYSTPLTPGLQDVINQILQIVNERIIESLKSEPNLTVRVRQHPPKLSPEEYSQYLFIYRKGVFRGFHDTTQPLGPDDTVHNLDSSLGGTATFAYEQNFANVIGSDPDPKIKPYTSWISLYKAVTKITPVTCTSFGYLDFKCSGGVPLGGHVIKGTTAQEVTDGSDSVYIMPICINHNNNDSTYMAALKYTTAVWLKNYMN